jgi:hypothetical protein
LTNICSDRPASRPSGINAAASLLIARRDDFAMPRVERADQGKMKGFIVKPREIPLWLAVHEAGHVIARIQLVAGWHLTGLE